MHYLRKDSESGNLLAAEYFASAVEADPSFARAYAGLAESYANRSWYERDQAFLKKAEAAVTHALQLDDRSAQAYFSLGDIRGIHNDHSGALAGT